MSSRLLAILAALLLGTALLPAAAGASGTAPTPAVAVASTADATPATAAVPRAARPVVGGPTARADAPAGIGTALSVARVVRYLGIGGATGLLALLLVVWAPLRRRGAVPAEADEAFVPRAGRALRVVAVVGVVGSLAALVLQAADAGGTGVGDALRPGTLGDVVGTRTGAWFLTTALASAVLAGIAGRVVRTRGGLRGPGAGWAIAASVLGAVLVVAPALGGHAVTSSPAWALVPIQIVHVAGMGAWLGGLVGLLVVLPAALRALPDGLPRLGLLAGTLLRFSPLALGAVGVLTLAGTGLAILHLTTLYDLTDTAYGRAILVKVVLLTAAIGVAVVQREFLIPQLRRLADGEAPAGAEDAPPPAVVSADADVDHDDEDPPRSPSPETVRHVRLALRSEVLLLVAVLGATGALAGYAPPKSLSTGPVAVTREVQGAELRLTVDPARTGRNVLRLRVLDGAGRPVRGVRDLSVRAVPPGRSGGSDVPVDVPVVAAGPGRWAAAAVPLGTPGGWTVEVRLRLAASGQVEARFPVRVR